MHFHNKTHHNSDTRQHSRFEFIAKDFELELLEIEVLGPVGTLTEFPKVEPPRLLELEKTRTKKVTLEITKSIETLEILHYFHGRRWYLKNKFKRKCLNYLLHGRCYLRD